MRILLVLLFLLLLGLQYRLWVGQGSLADTQRLQNRIDAQNTENAALKVVNDEFYAEIEELKLGKEAVEEHARTELGMIRDGETFYLIVDGQKDSQDGRNE